MVNNCRPAELLSVGAVLANRDQRSFVSQQLFHIVLKKHRSQCLLLAFDSLKVVKQNNVLIRAVKLSL